jgi:hypothetical protein
VHIPDDINQQLLDIQQWAIAQAPQQRDNDDLAQDLYDLADIIGRIAVIII